MHCVVDQKGEGESENSHHRELAHSMSTHLCFSAQCGLSPPHTYSCTRTSWTVLSYYPLGITHLFLRKTRFVKKSLDNILKLHHSVGSTALEHKRIFNPFLTKQVFSSLTHSIWTHIQFLMSPVLLLLA